MGITVIRDLKKAANKYAKYITEEKLISELINDSKHYRHPDSATISYAKIVENPVGRITTDLDIGIVGGGSSGICALYELSKIAAAKNNSITVTIYESDKDSFLNSINRKITQTSGGRISAATVTDDGLVEKTVYEIGAMRFPETAGLTWHYAGEVFVDQPVKPFPNPGVVATEFVFGNRVDRYMGDRWEDPSSPTKEVKNLVIDKLWNGDYYTIGGKTPKQVSELLENEETGHETLKELHESWKTFATTYDGTTLGSAVRKIISDSINERPSELPDIDGLLSPSAKVNYYFELFGRFGFGTGGFKPIFNISLVEMMRLLLWNYSTEYSFPVKENTDLIKKLFIKANDEVGESITIKYAEVCDVFHKSDRSLAGVAFYDKRNENKLEIKHHDYVILAIPSITATKIISRFGSTTQPISDGQVGNPSTGTEPIVYDILPPLLLSIDQGKEAVNAQIITAVDNLHMTRSAKVFATILKENADKAPKINVNQINDDQINDDKIIRAVISDCGLASSYMVPSPTNDKYFSFLVSYTWEDDSTKQQYDYHSSKDLAPVVFSKMLDRSHRWVRDNDEYKLWWLAGILNDGVENEDKFFFDWTTNDSAGGFKLDLAGDYYQSNLCFRYHTHATSNNLKNRFFLASDSYSHLGGWIEGAFMSAINAVSGIVVAANNGSTSTLNPEAKKLFDDLDPVIPKKI